MLVRDQTSQMGKIGRKILQVVLSYHKMNHLYYKLQNGQKQWTLPYACGIDISPKKSRFG